MKCVNGKQICAEGLFMHTTVPDLMGMVRLGEIHLL